MQTPIRSYLVRRLAGAALATVVLAAAPAHADEFDWLYFPMYVNDTAHAVHLKSLKFRPDGLLEAATRYPRTSNDWTGPESEQGWYSYDERLIDCETGHFVETTYSLLDHDSAKLASRASTEGEQLARLKSQLTERTRKWPDNSDIFLACAAASNGAFQRQRAAAAAKVQPLFSDRSLIEVLSADTEALRNTLTLEFDFDRSAAKPAAPASQLFDAMRAQYAAWHRSFNAAWMPARADAAADKAALALANEQLQEAAGDIPALVSVHGGVIEITDDHAYSSLASLPPGSLDAAVNNRIDCDAGIAVPVALRKIRAQKLGPAAPLPVKAVLRGVSGGYGRLSETSDRLHERAALICRLVKEARAGAASPAGSTHAPDDRQSLPYGLDEKALAALPTPQAKLLAIRAARRNAR